MLKGLKTVWNTFIFQNPPKVEGAGNGRTGDSRHGVAGAKSTARYESRTRAKTDGFGHSTCTERM